MGKQRGTGVRVRSEAKAAVADRLLYAAQEASETYLRLRDLHTATPKRRWIRRKRLRDRMVLALAQHHHAITAAQDIAKKGRYAELD